MEEPRPSTLERVWSWAVWETDSVLEQALPGVDAVMHLAGYIEVAESQAAPEGTSATTWPPR